MTIKDLVAKLESVNRELQTIRRSDFEIPGADAIFAAKMRQHIVNSIGTVRINIDDLVTSLDQVDDAEKILTVTERISNGIKKMLGPANE